MPSLGKSDSMPLVLHIRLSFLSSSSVATSVMVGLSLTVWGRCSSSQMNMPIEQSRPA